MSNTNDETFPDRVNVMKVITYDVHRILEQMVEEGRDKNEITMEHVIGRIYDYARDDFACGLSQDLTDLIFEDSNGEYY